MLLIFRYKKKEKKRKRKPNTRLYSGKNSEIPWNMWMAQYSIKQILKSESAAKDLFMMHTFVF